MMRRMSLAVNRQVIVVITVDQYLLLLVMACGDERLHVAGTSGRTWCP